MYVKKLFGLNDSVKSDEPQLQNSISTRTLDWSTYLLYM